ncbi:hypothetical protein JNUCC0626_18330 [Lentzea sp. JNUCC 0626]|uniref:hypothetical protein n=1 Tax=Lentzea sp. JNUCC 0626 TaxID=3367513 RepID=UPI00374A8E32
MARVLTASNNEIFRAVVVETITREGEEPRSFTSYYGPFVDRGPASSAITRAKTSAAWDNDRQVYIASVRADHKPSTRTVEGHVESLSGAWERVTA